MNEGEPRDLSPLERGKLKAFTNVLSRAHSAEEQLDTSKNLRYIHQPAGKPEEVIFYMDQTYVNRMKGIAFDIYTADLVTNPTAKAIADGVLHGLHNREEEARSLPLEQEASLRHLLRDEQGTH